VFSFYLEWRCFLYCFTCPTGQDTHVERVRSTKVPPGHVSHVRRAVSENLPGGQTMADDIQSIRFKERDKKLKRKSVRAISVQWQTDRRHKWCT
jgi:hypothetical protein